jgi:Uma2 family endonuclease
MSIVKDAPISKLDDDDQDDRYEIIDGIRVEKQPMGLYANILATYLATMINIYAIPKRLGMAICEADHKIDEKNTRRPDIAYVQMGRLPAHAVLLEDPPAFEGVPDLAIEVISPSNKAVETEKRIAFFFSTGVQAVWIIYPTVQRVHVYDSAKESKILGVDDILHGGKVLPGFLLKLYDLFNIPNLPT